MDEGNPGAFVTDVDVRSGGTRATREDHVAHEEPLELQLGATSLAVLMRTPGHDVELALGFLLTERIVERASDVDSMRHCTTVPSPEAEDNVLRIALAAGVAVPPARRFFASSSCGVCGKATIEAALGTTRPVEHELTLESSVLAKLPELLRANQPLFRETGGLHGAGLFDGNGALHVVHEDVGRHNAVDKVVGAATRAGVALEDKVLMVSGRVSFEIVQKASAVGLSIVAGISAPTSLAIRFGEELGVTVVGFLRERSMNVYSRKHRIL
jgi:FdhD protein